MCIIREGFIEIPDVSRFFRVSIDWLIAVSSPFGLNKEKPMISVEKDDMSART